VRSAAVQSGVAVVAAESGQADPECNTNRRGIITAFDVPYLTIFTTVSR